MYVVPTWTIVAQGLSGSAQRYVRFLLASTAGYKEAMLHQNGCLHALEPSHQHSAAQPLAAQDLHIHFMSHCEHHMLPFHGQASFAIGSSYHSNPGLAAKPCGACCASQHCLYIAPDHAQFFILPHFQWYHHVANGCPGIWG